MREQVFLFCVLDLLLMAMIIPMIASGPGTWGIFNAQSKELRRSVYCAG